MSTWFQDLQQTDPKLADAYRVVGNQPRQALLNMVRALQSLSALNTPEEDRRLEAAQYIIGHTRGL